ncbi:MAG: [Fe-Fe] hydrogenase large subunit C-terminal domain-containing protein [Ignavibacteriales bacterium]
MSNNINLPEVIKVDKEKCTNCHLCIGVCPVKYCNNASDANEGIRINSNLCIGCGACVKACTHKARYIVDDTEKFINDLRNGEKIAVLVAPATDVNFPHQLKNLLGWFKTINVSMSFDVSFGAEITTYQYLKAIKNGAKTPIIAQPCPCVVSYIELYKPNLMQYLAPTGSPTMDMAAWVHHNHPGLKLAFISPCAAKKREFEDPNTKGMVSYNVTIAGLKKYFADNGINLEDFQKAEFDGPLEAEKGLLFSQPGGLHETFKRYNVPLKLNQVRRTEGVEIYEEFFNELEDEINRGECDVVIVDVLNCLHGCNRGTGTIYNERTTDDILKMQSERLENHQKNYYSSTEYLTKLDESLKNMEDIDFSRNYTDKSESSKTLQEPTPEVTDIINEQMGKFEKKDIKNCGACGYASCTNMTKAILNGLYRPEQCHHFLESFYNKHSKEHE